MATTGCSPSATSRWRPASWPAPAPSRSPPTGGTSGGRAGTAGGAVLDPGAPTVQVGELGDQRQADPRAGGVPGDVTALVEGLEDLLAELRRHARPLVLHDQQGALAVGVDPHPDGGARLGVPGRV